MLTCYDEGARLTALQLALQATATRWVQQRVKKWSCNDSDLDSRVEEMYETIFCAGELSTSVATTADVVN